MMAVKVFTMFFQKKCTFFSKKAENTLTRLLNNYIFGAHPWRDGRVVEGARLESVFTSR